MSNVDINDIIAFEEGSLDETRAIDMFQKLTDSGQVWQLQGFYGRTAIQLIEDGHITADLDSLPQRAKDIIEYNKKRKSAENLTNLMRGR